MIVSHRAISTNQHHELSSITPADWQRLQVQQTWIQRNSWFRVGTTGFILAHAGWYGCLSTLNTSPAPNKTNVEMFDQEFKPNLCQCRAKNSPSLNVYSSFMLMVQPGMNLNVITGNTILLCLICIMSLFRPIFRNYIVFNMIHRWVVNKIKKRSLSQLSWWVGIISHACCYFTC